VVGAVGQAARASDHSLDDITTVYNAALLLGITDVYKMSKDQLGQVREKLMEQKPLLTKYWRRPAN